MWWFLTLLKRGIIVQISWQNLKLLPILSSWWVGPHWSYKFSYNWCRWHFIPPRVVHFFRLFCFFLPFIIVTEKKIVAYNALERLCSQVTYLSPKISFIFVVIFQLNIQKLIEIKNSIGDLENNEQCHCHR